MTFSDPGLDLQRAIVKALKSDANLTVLVQAGVYDQVPRKPDGDPNVAFPYVSFGETQTIPELAEETNAAETFVTLHTWSRTVGFGEVKAVSAAVIAALHDSQLSLVNGTVQSLLLQDNRIVRDPDGITSHGVITFQILTDAN